MPRRRAALESESAGRPEGVQTNQESVQQWIVDDLDVLVGVLPARIQERLYLLEDRDQLLEVIIDLGRRPEGRLPHRTVVLSDEEATEEDIQHVINRIGVFGDDNRAGLNRTLHRISAIRNRMGKIVGLTCRVGRAVYGAGRIIEDLIQTGKSVLLLGWPGVGKTTLLREVARVLADDAGKRVVIVDTSNEIAGDADLPHLAIGSARRMQVSKPALQHSVMIEAVENHMPQVIIIDEIGTELETTAARTIAERGVQLVATAHGNSIENLMLNPTLSDLVGGVHVVTLGDEEARRRHTKKTVLERKAPPTFSIVVELQSWERVAVQSDVASTVDSILRGLPSHPETRFIGDGRVVHRSSQLSDDQMSAGGRVSRLDHNWPSTRLTRVHPYGVSRDRLARVAEAGKIPVEAVSDVREADLLLTTKNHYRRKSLPLRHAEANGTPVYVLRRNTILQIQRFLNDVAGNDGSRVGHSFALAEAEEATKRVEDGQDRVIALSPQRTAVRRLQHQIAESHRLISRSVGKEPNRRVTIGRP